jgi:SAC3/GANP family
LESSFNFDDGIPPSLDVYQFIWDRTRMVRKDFILQNYVGTGGNCDARAVRCHERIARWHAMCEHQLSHIPEFIKQQSQQNIQELGQTMKTLNQYYDDSLNRSIVEVPDEQGNETRQNLPDFNHGCTHNAVQGPTPVDFDQTDLRNDNTMDAANRRLIGGRAAVTSAHHGTAEPEMRGLYILLTLENDGGMEVLKYAARLYQLRPNVYQSSPVQLALNIYKVRKETVLSEYRPACTYILLNASISITSGHSREKSAIMHAFFQFCVRLRRHIYLVALCLSM